MQLTSSGVYVTNFEQIQCNINLSNLLFFFNDSGHIFMAAKTAADDD